MGQRFGQYSYLRAFPTPGEESEAFWSQVRKPDESAGGRRVPVSGKDSCYWPSSTKPARSQAWRVRSGHLHFSSGRKPKWKEKNRYF